MAVDTAGVCALLGVVPSTGLLFGLMLLAAIVGGYAAHSVHVPRVVGFLVGGVALRGALSVVFPEPHQGDALDAAAAPLAAVKDLALGLILFSIGGVFERSRLIASGVRVLKTSVVEVGMVAALVLIGCALVSVLTLAGGSGAHGMRDALVLAVLLALAAIATAPAATLFVLREYDAKGPLSDVILSLTAVNNVACIVLFHAMFIVLAWSGVIVGADGVAASPWLGLVFMTVGSVSLGIVFGAVLSIVHTKLELAETLLVFFAVFIVLGAGEKWLAAHYGPSFNFLLTALTIGAVFANVAVDSMRLGEALRTIALPIFAGFFVMAGYELHVAELRHIGWIGGAYIVCRTVGKVWGCRMGLRWAGLRGSIRGDTGTALFCQAAVVIGIADFVERHWASPMAGQFTTVILGSIVVYELVGPVLVKRCVVQGGEVKAITLLSRASPGARGASVVRLTMGALLRMFGLRHDAAEVDVASLQVRHIMRSSVQLLRVSATFDDVLHFIERSTHSHFPVVSAEGDFVGMIHFADVQGMIYDPALRDLVTAVDLATPESATVPMDMPLSSLLDVFKRENVAVLPVVERGASRRIVGLVEQRDLLRALHVSA